MVLPKRLRSYLKRQNGAKEQRRFHRIQKRNSTQANRPDRRSRCRAFGNLKLEKVCSPLQSAPTNANSHTAKRAKATSYNNTAHSPRRTPQQNLRIHSFKRNHTAHHGTRSEQDATTMAPFLQTDLQRGGQDLVLRQPKAHSHRNRRSGCPAIHPLVEAATATEGTVQRSASSLQSVVELEEPASLGSCRMGGEELLGAIAVEWRGVVVGDESCCLVCTRACG